MLVDRYPAMNLFALAPDLAIGFDPVLRELDESIKFRGVLRLRQLASGRHLRPWPGTIF
jgi:hypothetical protein